MKMHTKTVSSITQPETPEFVTVSEDIIFTQRFNAIISTNVVSR